MTDEQIKERASKFAKTPREYEAYISGAHSRDEEIEDLGKSYHYMFLVLANKVEQLRNPWISVEDEKPVQDKDVIFMLPDGLVYRGFRKVIGIRDRVFLRGATKGTNCYMISDVTHWMPIPELEKGE